MKESITGSSVVNTTLKLLGVMKFRTPNICNVFSNTEPPGWVVLTVILSKKSKSSAAIIPEL
jgi:hypothetical protein